MPTPLADRLERIGRGATAIVAGVLALGAGEVLRAEPGRAAPPLPRSRVAEAFDELPRSGGGAEMRRRWLLWRSALPLLPPATQRARLSELARRSEAPRLAARARMALARHREAEATDEVARRLGTLRRWKVLGPRPARAESVAALHRARSQLPSPGAKASVRAMVGRISWQTADPVGPPGGVALDRWSPDEGPFVLHLASRLDVPQRVDAVLRLGAVGDLAVGLDGRLLGRMEGLVAPHADQLAVPVTLEPGRHRLSVTLRMEAPDRPVLYARLTDRRGRPLRAVGTSVPDARERPEARESPEARETRADEARERGDAGGEGAVEADEIPTLRPVPAARLAGTEGAERIRAAAARRALGLPDPRSDGGARLEEAIQGEVASAMPAAERLLVAWRLRSDRARRGQLVRWLERARRRDDSQEAARMALALAEVRAAQGRRVRAASLLERHGEVAERVAPEAAARVGARIERLAGRPEAALDPLGAGEGSGTPAEVTVVERAQVQLALDRPEAAAERLTRLQRALPGDVGYARLLAEALAEAARIGSSTGSCDALRGRAGEGGAPESDALSVLGCVAARRPDRVDVRLRAGALAARAGHDAAARGAMEAARKRSDWSVQRLSGLAEIHARLGDRAARADVLRRALDLRPGDPQRRAAWARVAPREPDAPFERALDAPAPTPRVSRSARRRHPFEMLAEEIHLRVQPDGGYRRWVQQVLRVHRVPDERRRRTRSIRFEPGRERIRVLDARVRRDGHVRPVRTRETSRIGEAWYGLYYDRRAVRIPFEDLQPGDRIELRWRRDVAASRAMPGSFDQLQLLRDAHHTRDVRLTLRAPTGLDVRTRLHRPGEAGSGESGDGPAEPDLRTRRTRRRDGTLRHRLHLRTVPALPREPRMPPPAEIGLVWQATTFAGWQELASTYRRLIAPQRMRVPEMAQWLAARREDARGEDGAVDRAALLRGIVAGVRRELRYVGLEFGVHGYKPYATDRVWARRFGDCKDQATLLTTLLRRAGFRARVVLVRTRPRGRVSDALASLALFDHAMVYLPDRDLYVDTTGRWHGLHELPAKDQGAQVLVLGGPDDARARWTRAPVDPPGRNTLEGSYTVVLRDDGSARVDGDSVLHGLHAADYRGRLADRGGRADRLAEILSGRYPGIRLVEHDVSDPTDRDQPLRLDFVGEVPQVAVREEGLLRIPNPAGAKGHAERLAGPARRETPLVVGPPATYRLRFDYDLPRGWRLRDLPPDRRADGPFGRYRVEWSRSAGSVVVRTELRLGVSRVAPDAYPAFRDFMRGFAASVRTPLELTRREAAPPSDGERPDEDGVGEGDDPASARDGAAP